MAMSSAMIAETTMGQSGSSWWLLPDPTMNQDSWTVGQAAGIHFAESDSGCAWLLKTEDVD